MAFARWLGVQSAFAFWKGRVAIYAVLRALGVREGDEVIMPGYTCVVAVNPVKYLGAKPVYVDIEPHTFNIDPAGIEAKITPRTRLIMAQHTYGYPAEIDEIMTIANRHGLLVLEDFCLAVGQNRWNARADCLYLHARFIQFWGSCGSRICEFPRKIANRTSRDHAVGKAEHDGMTFWPCFRWLFGGEKWLNRTLPYLLSRQPIMQALSR
jgi:hypothetical protein